MKRLFALSIVSLLVGAAGLGGVVWMAVQPERWHKDLYAASDNLDSRLQDAETRLDQVESDVSQAQQDVSSLQDAVADNGTSPRSGTAWTTRKAASMTQSRG